MVLEFLAKNWVNLGLVIVGSFAMLIYLLQEHKKRVEAASLIVMQINELQNRLREFSSYIVEGQLNSSAFYESLPLMGENYWAKYKHYFVRKMDHKSFTDINLFYDYASEIQEQQLLLKQLQKDSFSLTQKVLTSVEEQFITNGLNGQYMAVSPQSFAAAMSSCIPGGAPEEVKSTFDAVAQQFANQNFNFDLQQFWNNYNQHRQKLEMVINQNALTNYIPVQIRISMEKKLREYSMLNISGNFGYQMLHKLSEKRF